MQLFLDLDGVLADFDSYATQLFGQPVSIANQVNMIDAFWNTIHSHEDFYNKLPLMHDAQRLFDAVKHVNPIILTGLPKLQGGTWADSQKREWAARHFPGTQVITCLSEEKCLFMESGDVLVDDWSKYRPLWENRGGIFVLHRNAEDTIRELIKLKLI